MENDFNICSPLGQELAEKADVLESQRIMREAEMVDLTLKHIAESVESRESDIMQVMAESKGQANAVREIVVHAIKDAAKGLIWCPEYQERAKSDQTMMLYVGTHWQTVESQQWKDFVGLCAQRCGITESQLMNPAFMKLLYEATAFNMATYQRQIIPDGQVWLNMRNGTLVLSKDGKVELREHRKEDLFRYVLGYSYIPDAECPQWHKFLDKVLPHEDARRLLAEYFGYIFMPHHLLEKMLLLYGEGLNGKSVTLEIIEALLGSTNISYLSLADLTTDDVKRASIEYKMLNISHESGKDVNPNVLKQLTSGERGLIKNLYRAPRETNEYGKLIAAFNILPRAENTFGFFRRLLILPYEVTIPKEEIDRQLPAKLKEELPGILNWVLQSLPSLMERREFSPCESSDKALEMYRLQADNVRLFLNEACEQSESTTQASQLYSDYQRFCIGASLKPIGRNKFIARLESLGYEPVLSGNLKYFKIKLAE